MADVPPVPPDGAIEAALVRWFGRSYRTTIAGLVALLATVLPFVDGVPQSVVDALHAVAGLAAAGGLMVAKDQGVSGQS